MNIVVKATNRDLSDPMRLLVEKKLSTLEKYTRRAKTPVLLDCEIEESLAVERAGGRYKAEGNLSVDGRLFRAEAIGETLEGAVDRVRDELARELKRTRGRERNLMKRGGETFKRMLQLGRFWDRGDS